MFRSSTLTAICALALLWSPPTLAQGEPGPDLANALGCRACHLIGDKGGNAGPPLGGLGQRMSRKQLQAAIAHRRKEGSPDTLPNYTHLTGRELRLLTDFLSGL